MSERRRSETIPEEAIVPRGREIYECVVLPKLRLQDEGKFVVIDVLDDGYAMDDEEEVAFSRASKNTAPEVLFFFVRVGRDGIRAPAHRTGVI